MSAAAPFTDPVAARDFILAGNSRFTIVSKKTGTRYTYRVRRSRDKQAHYASVLYGADNSNDYRYVGVIKFDVIVSTGSCKLPLGDPRVHALDWLLACMRDRKRIPHTVEVWHEGRCGKCNRPLTDPESIKRGLGPVCVAA